jgi:hypothetical protein
MPVESIEFHVIKADTPFLFSLTEMNRLQVFSDNTKNTLVEKTTNMPAICRFGHAFLLWEISLSTYIIESFDDPNSCYLTMTELGQLHRRFGHPLTARLHRILERSGHISNENDLNSLQKALN